MPSFLKLALCLFAFTLVVPAMVWAQSTSWRAAWRAWKQYSTWYWGLMLIGLIVWAFTAAAS